MELKEMMEKENLVEGLLEDVLGGRSQHNGPSVKEQCRAIATVSCDEEIIQMYLSISVEEALFNLKNVIKENEGHNPHKVIRAIYSDMAFQIRELEAKMKAINKFAKETYGIEEVKVLTKENKNDFEK